MLSHIDPVKKNELPKIRDSISFIYLEYARVEQDKTGVIAVDQKGFVRLPAAALSTVLLGPGTTITHDAVRTLAESGVSIVWTGEHSVRTYASSTGETNKAYKLLEQARLFVDEKSHLAVVERMYRFRFKEPLEKNLDLRQIRGKEGIRVRTIYHREASKYGLTWSGRNYDRNSWNNSDPLNKALSVASSCLNGVCHAAIVSAGYSTAIGFIHTGKQLSFVYDIADLYKMDICVPVAFATVASGCVNLEREVRLRMRNAFQNMRLMERIVSDISKVLAIDDDIEPTYDPDSDPALPSPWWTPQR
ncbi:MAG: type I-E CRISPR-associated endonuclease Cas1 [Bacteroidetes bacterium]|nr:type I-E CRISPR-associated endonuclease Cas1 [Bacteroidota bacterium]